MNTAILLTFWNRKDKLKTLIEAIRENKPKKIYLACDGPRLNISSDYLMVEESRKEVEELIDWECSINKLYSEKNLGCRDAMTKAINWLFDNEEQGIILEEDCVPHKDFLPYCEELLVKYKNNKTIWNISGTNLQKGNKRGDGSYYFSKYFNCWGWASWRDRWLNFDSNLKSWPEFKRIKFLDNIFFDQKEIKYWSKIFDDLFFRGEPNSWAYRWFYTCLVNNALTVVPNKNLIQNIGFDKFSTNTNYTLDESIIDEGIIPLNYPKNIIHDRKADRFAFYNHYKMTFKRRIRVIIKMPLYYPKKLINKLFK